MRLSFGITAALLSLVTPGVARADVPSALESLPGDPSPIYGGTESAACAWPTTVSVEGSCSGTLVHPEVVIFAAHCGSNYGSIQLGESGDSPKRTAKTAFCKTNPDYNGNKSGVDFAFCKLAQPQTDIPIVPILMGCEVDQYLKPGQEVTIVGFGLADNGPYGIKREVVTTINSIQGGEAFIGGNGKDSCNGDSGGPVFVKIADGSWRVFGITSYGGACGTGGYYSLMHNGIGWIEQETGIDLTPCHSADGVWQPSPLCGSFPTEPGVGGGQWTDGCAGGPVGGFSTTCGPAACNLDNDKAAPVGTVTAPADDTMVMADNMVDPVPVSVTVDASDPADGGESCGVKEVRLMIDGAEVPGGSDFAAPYAWDNVNFPSGCYEVGAKVIDFAGNEGLADPHTLCVNTELPPPPPDTTGGDTGTGGGTGTGDPTDGGTGDASAGGTGGSAGSATAGGSASGTGGEQDEITCSCSSEHDPKGSLVLLLGLAGLGFRRRRAR